jgi:hypothetical protein
MVLGIVLMLVAVGADMFKTMYAAAPLEKKLGALEEELSTKNQLINDLTTKLSEADALKAQIKGAVGGFSMIEYVKIAFVLGNPMPKGNAKDTLLTMVRAICTGSQNSKQFWNSPETHKPALMLSALFKTPKRLVWVWQRQDRSLREGR